MRERKKALFLNGSNLLFAGEHAHVPAVSGLSDRLVKAAHSGNQWELATTSLINTEHGWTAQRAKERWRK